MEVWIFCIFGWEIGKCLLTPQKLFFGRRFDPLNGQQHQCNPQKAHPCTERRHMYRLLKLVHWCDLCAWLRNQKKTKNQNSEWQTGYSPRLPTLSYEDTVLHGEWPSMVVLSFKFDQNRLSGYRDCRCQKLGSCITLANGLYSPLLPYRLDDRHLHAL